MTYVVSFGVGLLVGLVYGSLGVRSPAPPIAALVGLLGMLAGEQVIPLGRHLLSSTSVSAIWRQVHARNEAFGALSGDRAGPRVGPFPVSDRENGGARRP
jgi:XapX domain-containing protein